MDIQNLTGLEKPVVKLIETVSEGVGVVGNRVFEFDAKKIKRISVTESEAEKQKIIAQAEGQSEALEILSRAEKRFAIEQYNKQINLENIIVQSRDNLEGREVSDVPVDVDWTSRFLNIAQDISREEMQAVLAKILSDEIQKPGTFSFSLLEIMKVLSRNDLLTFKNFIALSTESGLMAIQGGGRKSLEKYKLGFDEYLHLASLGLFSQSTTLSYNIDIFSSKPLKIKIGKQLFLISHDNKSKKLFRMSAYVFSSAGSELRSILLEDISENDIFDKYKTDFITQVEKEGFTVSTIDIKDKLNE
ncbi:MAG: DUF2806 domain-containing protein [Candidatus Moraniibacteriota bacterium]|jgi:Protein of unknown function (DUF2806)